MTYRTKQGLKWTKEQQEEIKRFLNSHDIKQERKIKRLEAEVARLKRKAIVNPLYNRPVDLKERVNREAEVEFQSTGGIPYVSQVSQWEVPKKQPFSITKCWEGVKNFFSQFLP